MNKLLYYIAAAFLLCGCAKEIDREYYPEKAEIKREQLRCVADQYVTTSCGINFNGNLECLPQTITEYGKQWAEVRYMPFTVWYDDESVRNYTQQTIIKYLTVCE